MPSQKLIGPFTQLLPMTGMPMKGPLSDEDNPIIPNGGILIESGKVKKVGLFQDLQSDGMEIEKIEGNRIALPGLIDAHTHSCYAGSRARDYAMRNAGKSYLEIAKQGCGIWDSVTKTREASQKQLKKNLIAACNTQIKQGVTTLEVKSGYGLSVEHELKMLNAIKEANETTHQDLIPTCLAAHMVPKDWNEGAGAYLEMLIQELLPQLKEQSLTKRIDAFIEETAFTANDIAPYFEFARAHGFDITVHADQFTPGGSQVAVDFGAISADHLEASTDKEIELLAKSNTVAMALPGASLGLGCAFTPARKLLDQGACLAIASDYNPGSAPMGNLLTQASILGCFEKLSNAEVLAGITFRAAKALGLTDRGQLTDGMRADFIAFPVADYREITYRQGQLTPNQVWIEGKKRI